LLSIGKGKKTFVIGQGVHQKFSDAHLDQSQQLKLRKMVQYKGTSFLLYAQYLCSGSLLG
jgi:hypothetical protein